MAFSSGFLSPPSTLSLSPTNLTVSILIPPDLYWSHPGSFARCLGPKQNEIWISARNNLRWSFLCKESQLFCSLGAANWLNGLSVRALALSFPPAYGAVGSHTVCVCEGGGVGWVSEQIFTCMHTWAHKHTHKLAHKHRHAPTLVHWAPEGFVCKAEKCHVSTHHIEV